MIGHAKWLLWEGYTHGFQQHPEQYSFFEKLLVYGLSAFRYGHQAVLFFFVLSGFVIHLKYAKNIVANGSPAFNVKDYLVKRIKRIYPPFLLAMLITFVLDHIGSNLNHIILYNGNAQDEILNEIVEKKHDLVTLIGNLFFIRTEDIGVWGSNGPSWSLKYEWWFYMIYPALIYVNKRSIFKSSLLIIILFISGVAIDTGEKSFFADTLKYLLIWWLGMLLADIYNKRVTIKHFYLAFLVLLLPLLVIADSKSVYLSFFTSDFLWGLGFFGLLNVFFYFQERGFVFNWTQRLQWLGDCSYTLYIIHFPILFFLHGIVLRYTNNIMPKTMVFIFPGIIICLVSAYLLHFVVEKPFTTKRR